MNNVKKVTVGMLIVFVLAAVILGLFMSGAKGFGNMSWFDTTYSFEEAVIYTPNGGVIKGDVQRWLDFENSDMIQVTIDGKTYLTHISNVLLISND